MASNRGVAYVGPGTVEVKVHRVSWRDSGGCDYGIESCMSLEPGLSDWRFDRKKCRNKIFECWLFALAAQPFQTLKTARRDLKM